MLPILFFTLSIFAFPGIAALSPKPGVQYSSSPAFVLPNLAGEEVPPFRDRDSRITVFLFLRTDCPISNRYAPEIQRLIEQLVRFATIARRRR